MDAFPRPEAIPTSPTFSLSPANSSARPRSSLSNAATYSSSSYNRGRSSSPISLHRETISAAKLASSDYFDDWRRGTALSIPFSVARGVHWDAYPIPQTIKTLGSYLLDVRLPEWVFENSTRFATTRINPLPGIRLVDMLVEEEAIFKSAFERIEEESAELTRLHNQQMHSPLNWRVPVDAIVRKAFVKPRTVPGVPNPAECNFICDLVLSMPYSNSSLNVEKTVLADTVLATSLYPNPSMFALDSQVFEELRVDKERHDSPVICTPHLLVKHANGTSNINNVLNEATNELLFLLAAGMQQRALLGFEREPLFGLACANGKVRAFAAYWKDHQIQVVRLYAEDLDLQFMEQAYLFFLLLVRIRYYIHTFVPQLESVDGAMIEQRIKSSERSWKAKPTHPSPPGTSWPLQSPVDSRFSSPLSANRRPVSPPWLTSSDSSFAPEVDMELDNNPASSFESRFEPNES